MATLLIRPMATFENPNLNNPLKFNPVYTQIMLKLEK